MSLEIEKNELVRLDDIKSRIFTIRGVQVMLDRDLAELYGVETRALKQSARRNKDRFPSDFMFELKSEEVDSLVSQFVIPSIKHLGGAKPFVFTEQGVAMLSAVLKSEIAVNISIKIMRAFTLMRKHLSVNTQLFQKIENIEKTQFLYQIETDKKFESVFTALESKQLQPKQGVFFDGQIFDAHRFVSDLVRSAERSIVLIDNFVDDIGASLKDLGKKWFAFSKMELSTAHKLLAKTLN